MHVWRSTSFDSKFKAANASAAAADSAWKNWTGMFSRFLALQYTPLRNSPHESPPWECFLRGGRSFLNFLVMLLLPFVQPRIGGNKRPLNFRWSSKFTCSKNRFSHLTRSKSFWPLVSVLNKEKQVILTLFDIATFVRHIRRFQKVKVELVNIQNSRCDTENISNLQTEVRQINSKFAVLLEQHCDSTFSNNNVFPDHIFLFQKFLPAGQQELCLGFRGLKPPDI